MINLVWLQWARGWRGRELFTLKAAWQGNNLQQSDQKKTKKTKDDQHLLCHYHHHYHDDDHHDHRHYHHELGSFRSGQVECMDEF